MNEFATVHAQVTGWFVERLRSIRYIDQPPCAWDINCGWCEDWARGFLEDLGLDPLTDVVWIDELNPKYSPDGDDPIGHAVARVGGRFYDSQHPEGVDSIEDLDIVRGVTRAEWLARSADGKQERTSGDSVHPDNRGAEKAPA